MEQVGPYRILEPIARGGMGVVFRALDPRAGREVALKVLPGGGPPAARARLLREAQALAKLHHPNVVPVHDAGDSPHGPYVALALIEGRSLADVVGEQGPLAPERAARIAADLARALEACHAAGIVHRDLKPGNVLLDPDGRPLLTDFGLALQSADSLTRLTQSGAILGTPGYFPPEQTLGQVDKLDARSDVYGLGATLYALLTGHPPVSGSTLAEVVIATRSRAVTPPSDSRPELDPRLDALVLRCLERDPARRFASAAELAEALEGYLRGEAGPRAPRRGAPWIAAGGLALVLAAAVVWALREQEQPAPVASPSSSSPATPVPAQPAGVPGVAFESPPLGTRVRVHTRFVQTTRLARLGAEQTLAFELTSEGEVVVCGPTSKIAARIKRVRGSVGDAAQTLPFDSARPDATSQTARLVAGDALALVGEPLELTYVHNAPEVGVAGLPQRVQVAGRSFDPCALAAERIRAVHGCFPVPATWREVPWQREIPFAFGSLGKTYHGRLTLRCRAAPVGPALDLSLEAASPDVTWEPGTPRIRRFHVQGRARVRGGWMERAEVVVTLTGQSEEGSFTESQQTHYRIELLSRTR